MGVKKNSLVDLFQRETVVTMEIPNPHSTSLGREEKGAKESLTQPKERERDVKKAGPTAFGGSQLQQLT